MRFLLCPRGSHRSLPTYLPILPTGTCLPACLPSSFTQTLAHAIITPITPTAFQDVVQRLEKNQGLKEAVRKGQAISDVDGVKDRA